MPTTQHLREVAARYAAEHPHGPITEIAHLLAEDELDRPAFTAVVRRYGLARSVEFRNSLLDLVLHVIRTALEDHCLTADAREAIRRLKVVLGIEEGAFYAHRQAEVRDILISQVQRLLLDRSIDRAEALHQVELQRLFDLGYDQYLELTREEFARVVDDLIHRITADGGVTAAEAEDFRYHLSILDTVYRLSREQRALLAQAGYDLS